MEDQWLLEQVEKKIKAGEYKEAVALLKKLKTFYHDHNKKAFVEKRLGEVYLELKFLDKARQHFYECIRLNSEDYEGYYFFSLVLFLSGRARAALPYIRKAIALNPDNAESYYLYGLALKEVKKYFLAEVNLRRALEFRANHIPALLELAKLSLQKGDCQEGKKFLSRILVLAPDYLPARELLGKAESSSKAQEEEVKKEEVAKLFVQKMIETGYGKEQCDKARKLWKDFLRKRRIRIKKKEVWAAAVHYAASRLEFHLEENQAFLADLYGVSRRSVSQAFQDICATVRLRLYDQRYSTQVPPFDDWEEL